MLIFSLFFLIIFLFPKQGHCGNSVGIGRDFSFNRTKTKREKIVLIFQLRQKEDVIFRSEAFELTTEHR